MTIHIKNPSKMKTIKLNKNSKARQPRTPHKSTSTKIDAILEKVEYMCEYAQVNHGYEDGCFEELEEMLWNLAKGR